MGEGSAGQSRWNDVWMRAATSSGAIVAALLLAVLAAFWPVLRCGFVSFDDPAVLLENPYVRSINAENLRWMFTQTRLGHYHPLTWLSYAVEHELWGLEPAGYHATNLALHAANAVLFFLLSRRLLTLSEYAARGEAGSVLVNAGAGLAAGLFALHPLRAESVAWVTERRDVLSVLFLLGATLAYLRFAVGPAGGRAVRARGDWWWYGASIVLLALSLLSKAWGMSFFAVALVLDCYPLRRFTLGRASLVTRGMAVVIAEKIPFLVLGLGAAAMAAYAQNTAVATKTLEQWGVIERLVQTSYGLVWYVRTSVWPGGLSVLYELPWRFDPWEVRFVVGHALLAALALVVMYFGSRYRGVLAAAAVYVLMLAPVLGLLQSGDQLVADRYSYVACMGLALVVAAGAMELYARVRASQGRASRIVVGAGAVLLVVLGARTHSQCRVWMNGETLWGHAAHVTPTPMVLTNYAIALGEFGREREGVSYLERAVELNPRDGRAWFMLGNLHRADGRLAEAERALRAACEHLPQAFMAHVNLGALYLKQLDRPADAVESFRAAVADVERGGRRPISAMPYLALGDALRRTGDAAGAEAAFRQALRFDETRALAESELRRMGLQP